MGFSYVSTPPSLCIQTEKDLNQWFIIQELDSKILDDPLLVEEFIRTHFCIEYHVGKSDIPLLTDYMWASSGFEGIRGVCSPFTMVSRWKQQPDGEYTPLFGLWVSHSQDGSAPKAILSMNGMIIALEGDQDYQDISHTVFPDQYDSLITVHPSKYFVLPPDLISETCWQPQIAPIAFLTGGLQLYQTEQISSEEALCLLAMFQPCWKVHSCIDSVIDVPISIRHIVESKKTSLIFSREEALGNRVRSILNGFYQGI